MQQLGESGLKQGRQRIVERGVIFTVAFDSVVPSLTIDVTGIESGVLSPDKVSLWIPTGFVVYPASEAAPAGWGTPVVQDTGDKITPYTVTNTSPGLALNRWTPGGPLGQVLLSTVAKAGYPANRANVVVPSMYDPKFGPALKKKLPALGSATPLTAYRIEFVDFSAQSPAPQGEQLAIANNKRAVFEKVNAHRVGIGRDPLLLPVRGFFDSGQIAAEIAYASHTLGHMSNLFPKHWKTADDQYMHDGARENVPGVDATSRSHNFTQNVVANGFPPIPQTGVDANGYPVFDVPNPGPPITPTQAVNGWLGSPAHKATIESASWDGFSTTTNIGVRKNFAAQDFIRCDQWIGCGNRTWQSSHAEIPVLSWFGFNALNLAWETWPCSYAGPGTCPPPTDPLTELGNIVDSNGFFWLNYTYAKKTSSSQHAVKEPALDNRIFARGRCIAIAPNKGVVWAAAIQKFPSNNAIVLDTYRLVALVHHQDEQLPRTKAYGMTPFLHVWYCDMPGDKFLAVNAPAIIRGVFGHEGDEGFAWDEVNNSCSWRDGGVVDVGTSDGSTRDLLKYASQWVFNSVGMKAACLRDTGVYSDYLDAFWPHDSFGALRCYESGDPLFNYIEGLPASPIELTFTGDEQGNYSVSKQWLGTGPAGHSPAVIHLADVYSSFVDPVVSSVEQFDAFVQPVAVGYDTHDALVYARRISAQALSTSDLAGRIFAGMSFGGYDDPWNTRFTGFVSLSIANQGQANDTWHGNFQVIDMKDEVVGLVGTRAFWSIQYFPLGDPHYGALRVDYTSWLLVNWYQTPQLFNNVRVWRKGALLHEQKYASPDGAVIDLGEVCYQTTPQAAGGGGTQLSIGVFLPLSTAPNVLFSYTSNRAREWIMSYEFYPQPNTGYVATSPGCICGRETLDLSLPDYSCKPYITELTVRTDTSCVTRGGRTTSSFEAASPVVALTQTTGVNPHFLYARTV